MLSVLQPLRGAPTDMRSAIEEAHARLHRTRCQAWLAATGHRHANYYEALKGEIPVTVAVAVTPNARKPRPWRNCPFHPMDGSP